MTPTEGSDEFKKRATEAHIAWAMSWYETDLKDAEFITKCDDGTATQWAFLAGAEWARSNLDSDGLVTMSQEQWDKVQAELKRYREVLEKISKWEHLRIGNDISPSNIPNFIYCAREALRGSGEK